MFERAHISGRYFAWEFARYLWVNINHTLREQIANRRLLPWLMRLLMLDKQADARGWVGVNDTPVDESVYTPNRMLRLIGNQKPSTPPFAPVYKGGKYLHGLAPRDILGAKGAFSAFASSLVSVRGSNYVSLEPSDDFPYKQKVQRYFNNAFGMSPLEQVALDTPYKERRVGGRMDRPRPNAERRRLTK